MVLRQALFRSNSFNTTESKDYFINPNCFGDDLAGWFVAELKGRNIKVQPEPGQEDFGWYIVFEHKGVEYNLLMGFRQGEEQSQEGDWLLWIERTGIVNALLGRRKRIPAEVALIIHKLMSQSPIIRDIRWFEEEDILEEKPSSIPA
jgi:hypothetical protein